AVGTVFGLDIDVVAIHQRDLIVHQQGPGSVGIGFFRGNVEVLLQDDGILVQGLSYYASVKQRVLRIESPLRPIRGLAWRNKLRRGA
ncbi:MAG: hypothetical protein ACRD72_17025, partial [Candidatus Angelobacter sp.]